MLISQVELPVSDAVQAARFYGDVLGLPTRTGHGVVEVEIGPSVLLLHPGAVAPGAYHCPSRSPQTALLRARRGCRSAFQCWSGTVQMSLPWGAVELSVPLLRRAGWDSARTDRTTRPSRTVGVGPIHQRRLVADQ